MKRRILVLNFMLMVFLIVSCTDSNKKASLIAPPEFRGMIIADDLHSLNVGSRILNKSGNSTDAAIAMAMTLPLTLPSRSSFAEVGVCKVYDSNSKSVTVYDFRKSNTFIKAMFLMHSEKGMLNYAALISMPELMASIGFKPDEMLLNDIKSAEYTPNYFRGKIKDDKITSIDLASIYTKIRLSPIDGYYNQKIYEKLGLDSSFYTNKPSVYADNDNNLPANAKGASEFITMDRVGNVTACSVSLGNLFGSGKMINGILKPVDTDKFSPSLKFEINRYRIVSVKNSRDDKIVCTKENECDFDMKTNSYNIRVVK